MQMQFGKRRLSGGLAIAVGLAACAGSLMSAEASLAAAPAGGINCVSSDGKVNGRGSSFQNRAQGDFWLAFAGDVCGAVPSQGANDTTVPGNMGVYNYSSTTGFTGSGNGLKAANCRTDAYAGTDIPYTEAQLGGLNGAPGNAVIGGCGTFPTQPFAPNASTNPGTPPVFPAAADAQSPLMSFPVAGSSVDIAINLSAANCGGTKPSGIAFTGAQMDLIWGGSALNWNDSRLFTPGGQNASLANCAIAIQRVVRQDNSGTTTIFKNYLSGVNDPRAGATCNPGPTWTSFNGTPNTSWPGPGSASCSPLLVPATSGGPAVVQLTNTTPGGVGYADLADITQGNVPALINAAIRNAVDTGYVAPLAGKAANCDFSVLLLPGATGSDAVGLNTGENWGLDNKAVNATGDHVNATDLGSKYPICGITFDLVYSNLGLGGGTTPNPIAGMTADQRRTLYSYFTYVFSSTAQNKLPSDFYAPLPSSWLPTLVAGFQGTGGY